MSATTRRLFTVLAIAALLRGALLVQNALDNPLADDLVVDAAFHHGTAARVVAQGLLLDEPFVRPPLYAYALALVQFVFGPSPLRTVVLQALLGLASLALLYRLAGVWLSPTGALLAVALAALHGPLAFFELKLLPVTLAVFLLLSFLTLLFKPPGWLALGQAAGQAAGQAQPRPGLWAMLIAGVLGGLFILCRPNFVAAPLLLVLWVGWTRWGGSRWSALVLAAGLALGVAPGPAHNAAAGDGSALVCSGSGFNAWLGNRSQAEVSFTGGVPGVEDAASLHGTSVNLFEQAMGRPPMDARELDSYWFGRAFEEIRADPGAWWALVGRKLVASLSAFEYGINFSYEAERSVLPVLWLFLVPSWLLLALGLPGLCRPRGGGVPGEGSSDAATSDARPPSRAPLLLVVLGVAVSSVVFFTYARFRLVAMPLLAIGAADVLLHLVASVRARRVGVTARWVAGIALVAWVSWLPPADVARQQLAAGHALVGFAALEEGDLPLAREAYERAVRADPEDERPRWMLQELSGR